MTKIQTFKQELSRVFDDNLHTKQWHNYVDYTIIGLIILSTVDVFLSTYDGIVEKYGLWLKVVDYFTTAFFTIEVSLRIWCADLIDDKYKGFWGRVRYCFSFYGLIDILSTYPFYLHFFMPMPYVALKALRIARLLCVFRYMKAFNVLSRAMRAKKDDDTYDDPNITLNDIPAFDALYKEFTGLLETQYSLSANRQRYHTNANAGYFARHLEHKVNTVALRVAWSVTARDTRAIQIAQTLAQTINRNINHTDNPDVPELKVKAIGYSGYKN